MNSGKEEQIEKAKNSVEKILSIEAGIVNHRIFTFSNDIMDNPNIDDQTKGDYKKKAGELHQKYRSRMIEHSNDFVNKKISGNELDFLSLVCDAEMARDTTVAMLDFLIEEAKKERYGKNA